MGPRKDREWPAKGPFPRTYFEQPPRVFARVCLFVCLFVCFPVCLFVCLSVCLFMCVSVCASVFRGLGRRRHVLSWWTMSIVSVGSAQDFSGSFRLRAAAMSTGAEPARSLRALACLHSIILWLDGFWTV